LIPRPEKELVEWIIRNNSKIEKFKDLKILWHRNRSGCIAISLAKNLPNATVSDVSEKALAKAKCTK
jgi:release factor glutamine methyltransferase